MEIVLKGLPKHSLNKIYAGVHWKKRADDKKTYTFLIKSQFKQVLKADKVYSVTYEFVFKNKPLDTSNTVYMLKMIEDVLFEDDTYKIIPELRIKSTKGKEDLVIINIKKINNP